MGKKKNSTTGLPHLLIVLDSSPMLDHVAPLVEQWFAKGLQSRVLISGDFSILRDYRWQSLVDSGAIGSYRFLGRLEVKFHDLIVSPLMNKLVKRNPYLFRVFREFGRGIWEKFSGQPVACLWGWGGPNRAPFWWMKLRGVRCVAVPHGYNFYLDQRITDSMVRDSRDLNFAARNYFDAYIVQSPNAKNWLIGAGMDPELISVLGSPRFSREWAGTLRDRLALDSSDSAATESRDMGWDVALFLPNWEYRVNYEAVRECVEQIMRRNLRMIVVSHPRPLSGSNALGFMEEISSTGKVLLDNSTPATVIIAKTKLVLSVGSSILLAALALDVPARIPSYLISNRTIFDELDQIILRDQEDLENLLDSVEEGHVAEPLHLGTKNAFFQNYVDLGQSLSEIAANYLEAITGGKHVG